MEGISWRIGLKLGKEVVATVFVIGTLINGDTVSAVSYTHLTLPTTPYV